MPEEQKIVEKKAKLNIKYLKLGMTIFFVIAGSIIFYFWFFKSNTLFDFIKEVWANLTPFIVGGVLSYLLKPICVVFESWTSVWLRKMKNRRRAARVGQNISVTLTLLLFLLALYVIFSAILPQVTDSIYVLINTAPETIENFINWLQELSSHNKEIQSMVENLYLTWGNSLEDWIGNFLKANNDEVMLGITKSVVGAWSIVKNILIGFISCIYILGQRKKLSKQGKMIIYSMFRERWADKIIEEIKYADKMFSGFINGKIIDSIIIGIITFFVTSIFKIPYAMLISVIIGITNIVPFFGPYIGAVPTAFIVLMVDPVKCLYFIIIIVIIQQFDGNVLGPKILGNSTGLSSFWVLFSIIFFGGIFGFIGMLIGVPLFAVLYDIVRQLVNEGLRKKNHPDILEEYQEIRREEIEYLKRKRINAFKIDRLKEKFKKNKSKE